MKSALSASLKGNNWKRKCVQSLYHKRCIRTALLTIPDCTQDNLGETKHLPILVDVLNERIDKTTNVEYDYVEDNEVDTSAEHTGGDYTSFDL